MEGEIVYEWSDLDQPYEPLRDEDTTSPLGQLYAKWNATNQRARDAYEARKYEIWRAERQRRWTWKEPDGDGREARTSQPASSTASTTIETVSTASGVEVLTVTVNPA
jgi:hypothetical protein